MSEKPEQSIRVRYAELICSSVGQYVQQLVGSCTDSTSKVAAYEVSSANES